MKTFTTNWYIYRNHVKTKNVYGKTEIQNQSGLHKFGDK